ncbi:MAG: ABC transporter ATP-binding protein [Sphingomonadaceae bacterium]
MSEPRLRARGLTRTLSGRRILDDVELDLAPGRVTAVLGPSGAGKSTLLRALAGLEPVDAGEIWSERRLLTRGREAVPPERRGIGIVFQDYALFPHLDALANVAFGLRGGGRKEKALARLEEVGLAERANAYPHQLSGGEQQRVALARALAPEPGVILLDEPFASLDSRLRQSLRERTREMLMRSGAAVLLVTHDAEEAMFMAEELMLMIEGRIVQRGAPDALYLKPASAAAARLLGEVNEWHGVVKAGALQTPFGAVAADRFADGTEAVALVRPEGLAATPSDAGKAQVANRHPVGPAAVLALRAADGTLWRARQALPTAPEKDARVSVSIDPVFASVVPGEPD